MPGTRWRKQLIFQKDDIKNNYVNLRCLWKLCCPPPAPTSLWHDVVSFTRSGNNKGICDLSSHSSKPYTTQNSPVCASLPTLSSEKLHGLSLRLLWADCRRPMRLCPLSGRPAKQTRPYALLSVARGWCKSARDRLSQPPVLKGRVW